MIPCPARALSVRELEGPGEWVWPEPVTGVIPDVGVVPKSLPLPVPREDRGVPYGRKERTVSAWFFINEDLYKAFSFERFLQQKHANTINARRNIADAATMATTNFVSKFPPVPHKTQNIHYLHAMAPCPPAPQASKLRASRASPSGHNAQTKCLSIFDA